VDAPTSEQFVGDLREGETAPFSDRQFVGKARDENVRDVAGRDVTFEPTIEAIGKREDAYRTGLNRLIEKLPGVFDQLPSRVATWEREPLRKTLFQLRLQSVIDRVPDVIAIETDGREARKRPKQLRPRDRRVA